VIESDSGKNDSRAREHARSSKKQPAEYDVTFLLTLYNHLIVSDSIYSNLLRLCDPG
jgi:hypothetical protein